MSNETSIEDIATDDENALTSTDLLQSIVVQKSEPEEFEKVRSQLRTQPSEWERTFEAGFIERTELASSYFDLITTLLQHEKIYRIYFKGREGDHKYKAKKVRRSQLLTPLARQEKENSPVRVEFKSGRIYRANVEVSFVDGKVIPSRVNATGTLVGLFSWVGFDYTSTKRLGIWVPPEYR